MRREATAIAVTGIGVVSSIGFGREQFWSNLAAARSGIAPLEGLVSGGRLPTLGAQVRGFAAREFIASANLRRMGKVARMVVASARMALDDARLAPSALAPERLGVVVGSALGELTDSVTYLDKVFERGPSAASPLLFPNLVLNAPASYVAMELGCTGINLTVAQGEISGEAAIVQGCDAIRSGRADAVLAGGGDEIGAVLVSAFREVGALAGQRHGAEWCSPYDRDRSGIVLGEGAAMLLLETPEHARARGVPVLALIDNEAVFCVEAPPYDYPESAPQAVARLTALGAFDLVVGSGNSSPRLDACELDLLGRASAAVTVTSAKGAIGEFGAAGALSSAAACLALHQQTVPPLCHLRTPEPDVAVRLAGREAEAAALRRALVLGIARGGAMAAISITAEAQR